MFMMPLRQLSIDVARNFALAIYSDFRALSSECARAQNNCRISERSHPFGVGVSKRLQKTNRNLIVASNTITVANALENIKTA